MGRTVAAVKAGPCGVIEGFYGPPWSWAARTALADRYATEGLPDYIYAPKDDPKHRELWRVLYDDVELAAFARFADRPHGRLGFAISPGLSMDYDDPNDRAALGRKVDQVVAAGATLVVLALDDIPFGGGAQGHAHARLTAWLHGHLGPRAAVALVPTEYVGVERSAYLDALASGVPEEVPIGWTGRAVVNDTITVADAEARATSLGGRRPLLWDNYPVNDALMSDRLFMGPLQGRPRGLLDVCSGYLANPMVQPIANYLPLASIAAFVRGEDPTLAWQKTAEALGWLTFAQACDGDTAAIVVQTASAGDLRPARAFFDAAATCSAPGIDTDAERWLIQVQRDARLALQALAVIEGDRSVETVMAMTTRWQASRRSPVTVFGARCSIRPVITQAHDGGWTVDPAAFTVDANAIDTLVGLALASL